VIPHDPGGVIAAPTQTRPKSFLLPTASILVCLWHPTANSCNCVLRWDTAGSIAALKKIQNGPKKNIEKRCPMVYIDTVRPIGRRARPRPRPRSLTICSVPQSTPQRGLALPSAPNRQLRGCCDRSARLLADSRPPHRAKLLAPSHNPLHHKHLTSIRETRKLFRRNPMPQKTLRHGIRVLHDVTPTGGFIRCHNLFADNHLRCRPLHEGSRLL
jgi:hypothetical protein